jgi:hypothetical protein
MRPDPREMPRLRVRPSRPVLSALALAAIAAGAASQGACIKRGYPLAPTGQVDIRTDVAGPLFAAGAFDAQGKPTGPRQNPYSSGVKLFMTEGGEAAFGGVVEVRVEPSEALTLYSSPEDPDDDKTCFRTEGSFQCRATTEGYASFVVFSETDWSGEAKIVVTWSDQRKEQDVTVLPAGLPEDATNFALIAGGLDNTDRVLATFVPLKCTIGPVPDDLGSKWREGEIRVREAFVRATPPSTSPTVVENAPVTIESLHSEAALALDPSCKERQTRLRVLLGTSGESPPFYICFSDIGGNVELAVTSGQKTITPNREIQVDPEPRLLRVRTLMQTVEVSDPVGLFEISAYNADRVRIAMPVDLVTSDELVLPLDQASVTLNDENNEATIVNVVPGSEGQATLHVTPRLLTSPDCASQTITVVTSLP